MKRILLPLEETPRSLTALSQLRKQYSPDEAELILLMVDESQDYVPRRDKNEEAFALLDRKLDMIASAIDEYQIIKKAELGKAGPAIVRCARDYAADMIMMTRSSGDDNKYLIGKTAEHVLIHAECDVLIVTESTHARNEYTGLIYRKAEATVNLRGRLSFKQSECLIPSISTECVYTVSVTRGRVRFVRRSYNPITKDWDIMPDDGGIETVDIMAGETVELTIAPHSVEGKADRIRIINRNNKTEAVFTYKITAAKTE